MTSVRLIGAGLLLLTATAAYADPCQITIESNDAMQFNAHEIAVPAQCTDVEAHSQARRSPARQGHGA